MESGKQAEIQIRETHHRVKNNFAILVSLISMQMMNVKTEETIRSLNSLQLRIKCMALFHEMLSRADDPLQLSFSDYLRRLAGMIAGQFNRKVVDMISDIEEISLKTDLVMPLGLIVNELVSNAFEHAFHAERSGKLWINFRMDLQDGTCRLEIRDNGVGIDDTFINEQASTQGLQIVRLLCTQLDATLQIGKTNGTSFLITFSSV